MRNLEALKQQGDVIWNIANLLRGPYRPPQYRRVMIPLTVLRRLDCVLEPTKGQVLAHHQQLQASGKYDDAIIEKMVQRKFSLPFHNTSAFTFRSLLDDADKLAANLVAYIAGFSSNARKILEKFKFEEEIEKLEEANRLFEVMKEVAAVNLHPDRIANIEMGYLFEDLVRRFNEQANEEAGDHFTPREVIKLMVQLLFTHDDLVYVPGKVIKIYDHTCGTGGMLSESDKVITDPDTGLNPGANLELYGQEYNPESYAICGSDLMIKGEPVRNIVYGNTLGTGKPKEGFVDGDGHPDERFHYMLANPPFGVEWKPEKDNVTKEHNQFGFDGRFGPGLPRINDGALLFLMHMISKMRPADAAGEGSRIAVVFNGSPLFTGDAGSGESNIRRWIIENDMLEAVVGLPDQLFYNTGISTYVWLVTNRKRPERRGKVQLINATDFARRMKKSLGDKRKRLGDGTNGETEQRDGSPDQIAMITRLYGNFGHEVRIAVNDIGSNIDTDRDPGETLCVSKVFDNQDFGYLKITVDRPLRLNFAVSNERLRRAQRSGALADLVVSRKRKNKTAAAAEVLAGRQAQAAVLKVLRSLRPQLADVPPIKDRAVFDALLGNAFKAAGVDLDAGVRSALLAPGSLGQKDPSAEVCHNRKGEPEPDAELRDTESVPLPPGITLPLPLDYEGKKNKGKVSLDALLALVKDHCEAYLAREVLPYRSDAWIDHSKTKVGYEIPFNRHFYEYKPPRPLADIERDIEDLERDIVAMLKGITA
jgi:type I restriction enzyme M protein